MRCGARVRLLPFEDQPEQTGVVLSPPDRAGSPCLVSLDPDYVGAGDDGLREVPVDQLEEI